MRIILDSAEESSTAFLDLATGEQNSINKDVKLQSIGYPAPVPLETVTQSVVLIELTLTAL